MRSLSAMSGEAAAPEVLRLDGAGRSYGADRNQTPALSAIDLSFRAGELVVLRGRSGSGKTTLLNLAGLLDRPDEGRILFAGQDTTGLNDRRLALLRRGNLGYVLQDSGVVERMSAFGNVTLPGLYSGYSPTRARKLARAALESVALGDKMHRLVGQLSGGERMRVGLARALVLSPQLVICDEPTASLDAETAEMVIRKLQASAAAGACVIAASHDPIVIERADRTISLTAGRVSSLSPAARGVDA